MSSYTDAAGGLIQQTLIQFKYQFVPKSYFYIL